MSKNRPQIAMATIRAGIAKKPSQKFTAGRLEDRRAPPWLQITKRRRAYRFDTRQLVTLNPVSWPSLLRDAPAKGLRSTILQREVPRAPRIAVIMPAHGVAHLVAEALTSLQAQSLSEWECVVVDDGALDDVAGAVAPFLSDLRIRFLATPNRGVSAARNSAIRETSAPYIALLDGDDLLLPTYLERMVVALDADPDARLVTCNAHFFGAVPSESYSDGRREGRRNNVTGSLADVLQRRFNVHITSSFRRSEFEAVGGFDESMTHAEDLDLWVRLLLTGGHARYIPEVLSEYRVRPASASASGIKMLMGNMQVYRKAAAMLGDRREAAIALSMLDQDSPELAFESAVEKVLRGEVQSGIASMRQAGLKNSSAAWQLSFWLWKVLPWLAAPMLRRRQRANMRGASATEVPALSQLESA